MKRQHLVVAAMILAATTLVGFGSAKAETQLDFLRNKNNYAKTSFQYQSLANQPQRKFSRRADRRTVRRVRNANPIEAVAQQFAPRQIERNTRRVVRQLHPRQVERNAKAIIRVPFDAIDSSFEWFRRRKGKNLTGFSCLGCGREQRLYNIAHGYKDCVGGDVVGNWRSPACTTSASPGQIGSLRIWNNGQHIERVIGVCANGILVGDGNGPGGVNSVRCTTIAGAHYRMPIKSDGPVQVLYMQPNPVHLCGRRWRRVASR